MKRALARRLAAVEGFRDPSVSLEQYATPPELAANIIHVADLQGDLDRQVVDLGTGTGMLALAAATRRPPRVIGLDLDRDALTVAQANEDRVAPATAVSWIQADATTPPLDVADVTVVSNPPFGAQHGRRGTDRAFLDTARAHAVVSYSIHNEGSREFIEAYAGDHGGTVTHAFAAAFPVDAQFDFHTQDRAELAVEVYRIEWPGYE